MAVNAVLTGAGEHGGAVGAGVLGGDGEQLRRVQRHARGQGGGDDAVVQGVPIRRGGQAQAAGGAGGLGEQVPPSSRSNDASSSPARTSRPIAGHELRR